MAGEGAGAPSRLGLSHIVPPLIGAAATVVGSGAHVVSMVFLALVTVWLLVAMSAARLVGLVVAPLIDARDDDACFVWGREHARAIVRQATVVALAAMPVRLVPSIRAAATTATVVALVFVTLVVCIAWIVTSARVQRYVRDHGGLRAALRLSDAADDTIGVVASETTRFEQVVRFAVQFGLGVVFIAVIAVGSSSYERVSNQRRSPTNATGSTSPSPPPAGGAPHYRANKDADEVCNYPDHVTVDQKIRENVPDAVGLALSRVLINPDGERDVHAPGVTKAGCPDHGSGKRGNLFTTDLFDAATGAEQGLIVSDSTGNAAVVFDVLRTLVARLVEQNRVVRVSRRIRTKFGDTQVVFLDDESCAVALREYNHPYVVLTGVPAQRLMLAAQAHGEIPRISPMTAGAPTYTLTFEHGPQRTMTIPGGAAVTTAALGRADDVERTGVACPEGVWYVDFANRIEPPDPASTP